MCSRVPLFSVRRWCDLGKYESTSYSYRQEEGSEGVIRCRVVSTVHPALRPPVDGGAPSLSRVPLGQGDDGGGVLAVVQEADVTREALHDVTQEEGQLREYVSVMRAVHDAMNEEASEAKAAAVAAQAELIVKLDSAFFRFYPI